MRRLAELALSLQLLVAMQLHRFAYLSELNERAVHAKKFLRDFCDSLLANRDQETMMSEKAEKGTSITEGRAKVSWIQERFWVLSALKKATDFWIWDLARDIFLSPPRRPSGRMVLFMLLTRTRIPSPD
jgi:hypothetical protein